MSEDTEGSFYCFVPRSNTLLGTFIPLVRTRSEHLVNEKLDSLYKRYEEDLLNNLKEVEAEAVGIAGTSPDRPLSPKNALPSQVVKYVFPGAGVTVQPGIQQITECLVRITPHVHSINGSFVVFLGHLSNLSDLLRRQHEWGNTSLHLDLSQADTGTLTSNLLLELFNHYCPGKEVVMLSELQGQYAFVIYDSNRKTAFAVRDPSGHEPLYYRMHSDGSVSFTNDLSKLPDGESPSDWEELPPGHYISGKHAKVYQFALTPQQLDARERHESLDSVQDVFCGNIEQ